MVVVVSLDDGVADASIDGGGVVNEVTVTVLLPLDGHGVVDGLWTGLDGWLRKTVRVEVLVECSVVVVMGSVVATAEVCFSVAGLMVVGLTVVGSTVVGLTVEGLDDAGAVPCS